MFDFAGQQYPDVTSLLGRDGCKAADDAIQRSAYPLAAASGMIRELLRIIECPDTSRAALPHLVAQVTLILQEGLRAHEGRLGALDLTEAAQAAGEDASIDAARPAVDNLPIGEQPTRADVLTAAIHILENKGSVVVKLRDARYLIDGIKVLTAGQIVDAAIMDVFGTRLLPKSRRVLPKEVALLREEDWRIVKQWMAKAALNTKRPRAPSPTI